MPRLESVVAGRDPSGITKSAGWEGGGGFRVLDVHPSMFERHDFGAGFNPALLPA